MRAARFDLIEDILGDGAVAVYRPHAGEGLGFFALRSNTAIVTGFAPDRDWFAAQGYVCANYADCGIYDAAVVCVPRAKEAAFALIARACREVRAGGLVFVDGQKSDGIDSVYRACVAQGLEPRAPFSKAHGKIFSFSARPVAAWDGAVREVDGGFYTRAGVFSADGPDPASVLLADALPAKLGRYVVDLGAGWGYLSRTILAREGVVQLDLVEAEYDALAMARRNITDARARFLWADVQSYRPERKVDCVVMNPPFHLGRAADIGLGIAFLQKAAQILSSGGQLWLVANRHLPYMEPLSAMFRNVEDIAATNAFRVVRASHPQRR